MSTSMDVRDWNHQTLQFCEDYSKKQAKRHNYHN